MANAQQKSERGSSSKVLIVISFLLLLLGGAVIDPLAGLVCFVLGGMISLFAVLYGAGWSRIFAVLLLVIFIILIFQKLPSTLEHQRNYRSKIVSYSSDVNLNEHFKPYEDV
jgi:hypothetical protein